jgi:hypothetical protein
LVCWLLAPAPAFAFPTPEQFALPVARAGGAGRYFTGSPKDSYTCKVCHSGAPEPTVTVAGLPLDGYQLDTSYEVTINWSDSFEHLTTLVELTDMQGQRVGDLRLPMGDELLDPEYCQPVSDEAPGARLVDVPGNRQVISVADCGSQRLRFLWRTPSVDTGPVLFAGSAVVSDNQGDTAGDGVTEFARVLGSPSSVGVSAFTATGDCSASHAPRSGSWSWLIACAAVSALPLRRWRRSQKR